jgi:hypothetical protein
MARRRRASWRLGICGASERRMRRSATQGRAGSAADAAAPAPDLGACDVAACMKTMFVDARVIRGDTVLVGADGASSRRRVWNTVAVAVDAVARWNACGPGVAGADRRGPRLCCEEGGGRPFPTPVTEPRCSTDHVTWLELDMLGRAFTNFITLATGCDRWHPSSTASARGCWSSSRASILRPLLSFVACEPISQSCSRRMLFWTT